MAPSQDRLETYHRKRDFRRTPEPAGAPDVVADDQERRFVVQRHRASRLHYDFRLEIDGVLVSWAVPKGPTLDPTVRRGAFRTEDHPIEYMHFEGVIPAREYGGGDVIVWDTGTWRPDPSRPDASRALARGELHVDLFGQKLRGRFVLVRTSAPGEAREQWLLLHKHDDFAVRGWDAEDHPASALTGRTNDEVKADPDRLWRSDLPAAEASIELKPAAVDDAALAELDAMTSAGTWHVFDRAVRLTGLDREVLPGGRHKTVTKRDLVRYAARIAPVAVRHLAGHALQLPGARPPDWVTRVKDEVVIDQPAALVWAANAGAVEWSVGARPIGRADSAGYLVIDLEPAGGTRWGDLVSLARLYQAALEHLGVLARPALSGGRALQLWLPVEGRLSASKAAAWAEQLAQAVAAVAADAVAGKWHAVGPGETVLAPYSPRAEPGAPVVTPVEWDELDDPKQRGDRWTIRTVLDRVAAQGDPFRELMSHRQQLPPIG